MLVHFHLTSAARRRCDQLCSQPPDTHCHQSLHPPPSTPSLSQATTTPSTTIYRLGHTTCARDHLFPPSPPPPPPPSSHCSKARRSASSPPPPNWTTATTPACPLRRRQRTRPDCLRMPFKSSDSRRYRCDDVWRRRAN